MTINGMRRRLGRLERPAGALGGLMEALEESRRRALAGLPPRPAPSPEDLACMAPSLRGAWQRIVEGRRRVAEHVATTG